MLATNVRGPQLLAEMGIKRWDYLVLRSKEKHWLHIRKGMTTEVDRRAYDAKFPRPSPDEMEPSCLFLLYNNPQSGLRWAPRDALGSPCTSLAEWRACGYDTHQLLMSFIGSKESQVRQQNRFVRRVYSYAHMDFNRLVEVIRRLHPDDRLFCYVIPEAAPVHMYFDLDGDVAKFPDLPGREEECLNEFLAELSALFFKLFGRPLNTSGLLLLQSTSPLKVSWHLHFPSEGFRNVDHHKVFVAHLKKLALSKTATLLACKGESLVDDAPYSKNQNFRAPYCRKPDAGKLPLLPRDFVLNEDGTIRLQPVRAAAAEIIDEEVLWRCHPALAQPGAGYTYLELADDKQVRKRKRQDGTEAGPLTTENRARKLARVLEAGGNAGQRRTGTYLPSEARADTNRALTDEEEKLVIEALQPSLGPHVVLDQGVWFISNRTNKPAVRGVCVAQSARCVTKSRDNAPHVHASNRMAFTLRAEALEVMCFCDKKHHRLQLVMTPALQQLLSLPQQAQPVVADEPMPAAAVAVEAADAAKLVRDRALSDFVNQSVQALRREQPNLLKARRSRKRNTPEAALYRKMVKEIEQDDDPDELRMKAHFLRYKQRCAELRGEPAWASEVNVNCRHLDLSQNGLLQQILQHAFIAIQSGMGTNKTGVILVFLFIMVQLHPDLRVLIISNRITFAETLCARAREEDERLAAAGEQVMGFRSYTEAEFSLPQTQDQTELTPHQAARRLKANQALLQTRRLIISPQSLSRLFEIPGALQKPTYDIIIVDELMEIFQILHSSTMNNRRGKALEQLTGLMSSAKRVIVMDAEIDDAMALPLLDKLSGSAPFCKYTNVAKTIPRTYHHYGRDKVDHARWRRALVHSLQAGRKVFVVCNSKTEVESIMNDPAIKALNLRVKGLHADSSKEDRKDYISSVDKWPEVDLLIISPVISHGVNFDKLHFDELFIYGTDMSTMPCQLFQQALRVRQISTNMVHMFLKVDPRRHAHLTYDYAELEQELERLLSCYQRDYHVKKMGWGTPAAKYTFEQSTWEDGRRVLDSLPKEVYIHNERRINYGKRHFRDEFFRLIRETGGEIHEVQDESIEEIKQLSAAADKIKEADKERKLAELEAVVQAADLDAGTVALLGYKERHRELEPKDADALRKAKWKSTYGIELTDTTRMASIDRFAVRFGTDHRLEQADALQRIALASAAALRPSLSVDTDPVQYRWADLHLHEHTVSMLAAVGLDSAPPADAPIAEAESILRASTVVNATDQAATLEPGLELRARVVRDLEVAPMNHKAWWNTLKHKHKWHAREDGDLYNEGGAPVAGKDLHKVLLRRVRQFLNVRYGLRVGSKRLGRGAGRGREYQLDRTRWNDFSQALFRLPPQILSPEWIVKPVPKTNKQAPGKKTKNVISKKAGTKKKPSKKQTTGSTTVVAAVAPPRNAAVAVVAAAAPPTNAAAPPVGDAEMEWANLLMQVEIDHAVHMAQREAIGGPEELRDLRLLQQQGRHEDAEALMAAMAVA